MNNAIYNFREPKNEPVLSYKPGSQERGFLKKNFRFRKIRLLISLLLSEEKRSVPGKPEYCYAFRS